MVRFKPRHATLTYEAKMRFNSTMVRFKRATLNSKRTYNPGFNSTMVRFKPASNPEYSGILSSFQFHDGSIQAPFATSCFSCSSCVSIPRWFDSSQSVSGRERNIRICFNSTMVRFKLSLTYIGDVTKDEFQFHDGSIQACPEQSIKAEVPSFQFHDGSIQAFFILYLDCP